MNSLKSAYSILYPISVRMILTGKTNRSYPSVAERAASSFRGKRITLMGLGLLGRGVGDAAYLAECGADLIVTDLKPPERLRPSLEKLSHLPNIRYSLGKHMPGDFRDRDLIIRGAGVPEDSPYLAMARSHGIPIRMSADLFVELAGIPVIGVTGTRGKTTVSFMIHEALETAGVPTLLGGNIPGLSTLALVSRAEEFRVAVLELDSWQLEGFKYPAQSPHIGVFTTFYNDHVSYYRGDMERYLADKAAIFMNQKPGDTLIVGEQAAPALARRYPQALSRALLVSELDVDGWQLHVPGRHNRYNAACARAAALAFGVDEGAIRFAIENFKGVPGRLELVREGSGIRVYNDTAAVIPEAACAGLRALAGAPITLIMGGKDKGNDIAELVRVIEEYGVRVILLPGTGSDLIAPRLSGVLRCDSLRSALGEALNLTPSGGSILFSPVFSSHGEFANVYERGEHFLTTLDKVWTA